MELEGTVENGVIVLDDSSRLPEGTWVRISVNETAAAKTFAERFAQFKGAIPDLPDDLASQHEHYRLGTPKR